MQPLWLKEQSGEVQVKSWGRCNASWWTDERQGSRLGEVMSRLQTGVQDKQSRCYTVFGDPGDAVTFSVGRTTLILHSCKKKKKNLTSTSLILLSQYIGSILIYHQQLRLSTKLVLLLWYSTFSWYYLSLILNAGFLLEIKYFYIVVLIGCFYLGKWFEYFFQHCRSHNLMGDKILCHTGSQEEEEGEYRSCQNTYKQYIKRVNTMRDR